MTIEEIKIRQLANQHLLQPTDKMTVLHDLCGVQAQFMVNAMHSLKIRCSDYNKDTVKNGLVKNWTVRGTVHVFAKMICHYSFIAIMGKIICVTIGVDIRFGISVINGHLHRSDRLILLM